MNKSYFIIVVALASFLAGCFVNTGGGSGRPRTIINWEEQATTTSEANTQISVAPAAPVAPGQPMVNAVPEQKSAPYETGRRSLGSSVMYETMIQAADNMSVRVQNPTGFFACAHSPLVNGAPVFRMRHGSYQQDFLPSHPGWEQVSCTAVIMPNPGQYERDAPEIWLATNKVGSFRLWFTFYTYDGVNPQLINGSTFSTHLSFPNTPRNNGGCGGWSPKGCLYNLMLQASSGNLLPPDMALAQFIPVETEDPFHVFGI